MGIMLLIVSDTSVAWHNNLYHLSRHSLCSCEKNRIIVHCIDNIKSLSDMHLVNMLLANYKKFPLSFLVHYVYLFRIYISSKIVWIYHWSSVKSIFVMHLLKKYRHNEFRGWPLYSDSIVVIQWICTRKPCMTWPNIYVYVSSKYYTGLINMSGFKTVILMTFKYTDYGFGWARE